MRGRRSFNMNRDALMLSSRPKTPYRRLVRSVVLHGEHADASRSRNYLTE